MRNRNQMICRLALSSLALIAAITVSVVETSPAQPQSQSQENGHHERERGSRRARREGPSPFAMGICVGQTTAQQGIMLPLPEAGNPPTLDEPQKAAFRSAVESCRAELMGRPVPQATATSPAATPSVTITATPLAPSTAATPAVTPITAPMATASPTAMGPDTASP